MTLFFFQNVSIQLAFVALMAQILVIFEVLTLSDHDLVDHQSGQEMGEQNLSVEEYLPLNQCNFGLSLIFLLNIFGYLILKEHNNSASNNFLIYRISQSIPKFIL